jgi:hypothetical protein
MCFMRLVSMLVPLARYVIEMQTGGAAVDIVRND